MICPKCKKEIEYLRYLEEGRMFYKCYKDKDELSFEQDEFEGDAGVWACPKCHKTLFTSYEKAFEFILGKSKGAL